MSKEALISKSVGHTTEQPAVHNTHQFQFVEVDITLVSVQFSSVVSAVG